MPMCLASTAWMISVIAAGHNKTDACLLVAVIIVVGDENVTKAVDGWHVIVTEVVGDQFQMAAIKVATPDRACPQVDTVAVESRAFAIAGFEVFDTRVSHGKVKPAIWPDGNAMNTMIVVQTLKACEQFCGRAIGFVVAIFIFQYQYVWRLTQVNPTAFATGVLGHGNADRAHDFRCLVKGGGLVSRTIAIAVGHNDNTVAFHS